MQRRTLIFLQKSKTKTLGNRKKKFQLIHFKKSQFFTFAFLQKMLNVSSEQSFKNNNYFPNIVWNTVRKHQSYNPNTKKCSLYLNKKLEIARYNGYNLLNKRTEIINGATETNSHELFMISRSELSFLLKFSFSHAYVSQLPKSYCFKSS